MSIHLIKSMLTINLMDRYPSLNNKIKKPKVSKYIPVLHFTPYSPIHQPQMLVDSLSSKHSSFRHQWDLFQFFFLVFRHFIVILVHVFMAYEFYFFEFQRVHVFHVQFPHFRQKTFGSYIASEYKQITFIKPHHRVDPSIYKILNLNIFHIESVFLKSDFQKILKRILAISASITKEPSSKNKRPMSTNLFTISHRVHLPHIVH